MANVGAYGKDEKTFTIEASADLSAKQYFAMKFSSGQAVQCGVQGEAAIGILQNDPAAQGRASVVAYAGITEVKLGGTVSQGNDLTPNSAGKLIAITDPDEYAICKALSDGSSNERIPAVITHAGALGGGGVGSGVYGAMQYATVAVSSAELLAINATPKTIVAAPGAGYMVMFMGAVLVLDYVSAAYATNGILGLYETNASGTQISGTLTLASFLAQTADTIKAIGPLESSTVGITLAENKALVLTQATGESITGDSPVDVHCWYSIVPTGL